MLMHWIHALLIAGSIGIGCSAIAVPPTATAPTTTRLTDVPNAVFTHYMALHEFPELGKQETKTAQYVRDHLRTAGITEFYEVGGLPTAVVAVLDSGEPGPTVCLRAELDARPGHEATGLAYSSQVEGVMHSCGHDAHAAILLTLAEELVHSHALTRGRLVFLFQPAEEIAGGADDIVKDGILRRLKVQAIIAQHVAPRVPVGTVQISPGAALAGSTYFTLKLSGRGSHAAAPQDGDDLPVVAAEIAVDIAKLPARRIDVLERPCIISVTQIAAGSEKALNVLPNEAVMRGTIRSFEDIDRAPNGERSLREIVEGEVNAAEAGRGVKAELELRRGSPPTVNDSKLLEQVIGPLQAALPKITLASGRRGMFSEDFAYYTCEIPSLYFSLGIDNGSLGREGVHTDKFSVAPESLDVGLDLLRAIAFTTLEALK